MLADDSIQSMGGKARADALTAEQRADIAKKAAEARWSLPRAICGAPDRPLRIGAAEIPCYILEDETRVLVQSGMITALGLSHGGSGSRGGDRLSKFTHQQRLKSFMDNEILERTENPLKFQLVNGTIAYGYDATLLAKICFAVLDAAKEPGLLQKQQDHIIKQAELLIRGFAIVGITALVDEATGYQGIRDRNALNSILNKFLLKELAAWAKRFPDEFYKQIFRLRGWEWRGMNINRPSCVGRYTNDLVYERLAPGILEELKRRMPKTEAGASKGKLQQLLTENVGHPALQAHLAGLMALQRVSPDKGWDQFHRMVERAYPKFNVTIPLALPET